MPILLDPETNTLVPPELPQPKTYRIYWRIRTSPGADKNQDRHIAYSAEEAEDLVERLNERHPNIIHWYEEE